jgi:hypothetical protein
MKPALRLVAIAIISILCVCSVSFAQKTVHVRTYTRKDGTVVAAHDRSAPGTKSTTSPPSSTTRTPRIESARTPSTTSVTTSTTTVPATRPRTVSITIARDSHGRIKRSESAKRDFEAMHPCPSTGRVSGPCHGYVIDHVMALACGGIDAPSNMQWQTKEQAKAKDKWERKGCR